MSEDPAIYSASADSAPPESERDRPSGDLASQDKPEVAAELSGNDSGNDAPDQSVESLAPPPADPPPPPKSPMPVAPVDTSLDTGDVVATVLKTAQETLDQSLVVVRQVWEAIAPIARALAILVLRLLILVGEWGLEQLNVIADSPPSTASKPKRVKPKAATAKVATAPDRLSATPASPEASTDTPAMDGVSEMADGFDEDDLEDEELDEENLELDDGFELEDEGDEAAEEAEADREPSVASALLADSPQPKTMRSRLLGISWTIVGVLWSLGVKIGRVLLPKRVGDRLPDPLVGALTSALVVLVLWITLSIRSTPVASSPAPEPPPLEPVPIEQFQEPESSAKPDASDAPLVSEPVSEPASEPIPESMSEPVEDLEADDALIEDIPEDESPAAEEAIPDAPFIGDLQDQLADVLADYAGMTLSSVQANFLRGRLVVTVGDGWNGLGSDRPHFAAALWQRSQELGFNKLDVVDGEGTVLARSPVVGSQMVIFDQAAASTPTPEPKAIPEAIDQLDQQTDPAVAPPMDAVDLPEESNSDPLPTDLMSS
ncbi:hypothetical protein [Leptolyngbya sp. CCY15150]|uniref:hypothetical protein n=1 Tax=Leptolyngbya sp. CCY15150 TaxID=2767772 RepID=UPI0019522F77|nr:hypothetical protein [Leptolyngbya sp. CCY15150]